MQKKKRITDSKFKASFERDYLSQTPVIYDQYYIVSFYFLRGSWGVLPWMAGRSEPQNLNFRVTTGMK